MASTAVSAKDNEKIARIQKEGNQVLAWKNGGARRRALTVLSPMIALEVHAPGTILILGKTGHRGRVQGQPRQVNAGANHPLVMVRVDTNRICLEVKTELAVLDLLQLIFVKVGPAPDAGVNHMGKSFTTSNLEFQ